MLFHHNGYVTTDPRVQPAAPQAQQCPAELPDEMDVLVVGAGPAGMMTAAQLSVFPEIRAYVIDRRPHRLELGHADGIQARSVETFQAFNFANRIIDEAYRITECCFWRPSQDDPERIVRTARQADDPAGISEFPHLIVNQARVLDYFMDFMADQPTRMHPHFGWDMTGMEQVEGDDHPVHVTLVGTGPANQGVEKTVRAKYVLGADGAHSKVRRAIGAQHTGGVSYHAWGVMDVLVNTDFPDWHTKCIIQSKFGSILHIPREGGFLVRVYVDLGEVDKEDAGKVRQTPLEEIIRRGQRIFTPYTFEVKDVAWWSVYEVGHRVTDRFDDVVTDQAGERTPHVFIAGDACHTHSAKAGQGMNVSMQDGFNLAWKLSQVLRGLSGEWLLGTYTAERQQIAQDLIDFDREWSSRMAATEAREDGESIEDFYQKTFEFPAGFMTQYTPSRIIGTGEHQHLAAGWTIGKRFKSAPVMRLNDANEKQLGHLAQADGRWRIHCFADAPKPGEPSKLTDLATWLDTSADSPINKHAIAGADRDALFDLDVIYQQAHDEIELTDAPKVFLPLSGTLQLENRNKVFGSDASVDIFEERQVSRDGAIVVVRPDQYVAHVLPLDAHQQLADFFDGIFDA